MLWQDINRQAGPHLLYDDVAGEEEGDGDTDDEEDVVPALLGAAAHELLVVDTEEQADGEEREQATVEDLGDQNDHQTVDWKKITICQLFAWSYFPGLLDPYPPLFLTAVNHLFLSIVFAQPTYRTYS